MGRKMVGSTPRDNRITIRLNDAEEQMLSEKRARRGLDVSDYFRTLMEEDAGDQS